MAIDRGEIPVAFAVFIDATFFLLELLLSKGKFLVVSLNAIFLIA
jgi:hypothetical protein